MMTSTTGDGKSMRERIEALPPEKRSPNAADLLKMARPGQAPIWQPDTPARSFGSFREELERIAQQYAENQPALQEAARLRESGHREWREHRPLAETYLIASRLSPANITARAWGLLVAVVAVAICTKEPPAPRGAYIEGKTGTGKSTVFRIAALRGRPAWYLLDARKCADDYMARKAGDFGNACWNEPRHLLLDDIGSEPTAKSYGATEEALSRVISDRYDLWKRTGKLLTCCGNLSQEEVAGRYGDRVASRLWEMCAPLNLEADDQRGVKIPEPALTAADGSLLL